MEVKKRVSSKKNLFTKSIDINTNSSTLNKNQLDSAIPYFSSPSKVHIPEIKEELKKQQVHTPVQKRNKVQTSLGRQSFPMNVNE